MLILKVFCEGLVVWVVLVVVVVVLGVVLVVLSIEQNIEHRTLFSEQ